MMYPWHNSHRPELATYMRKYRKQHPEIFRAAEERRKVRIHRRFSASRSWAARKGMEWSLTVSQYSDLLTGVSCFYCGGPVEPTGCGLDRVNNLLGYTISNVVLCCRRCNMRKSDLSLGQLKEMVRRIEAFYG